MPAKFSCNTAFSLGFSGHSSDKATTDQSPCTLSLFHWC